MGDFHGAVRAALDDEEIRAIERRTLPGGDDHALSIAAAWDAHVGELKRARGDVDGESPWTAYDFVAALTVRDHLQAALRLLPVVLRERMAELTGPVDERYRACTVPDTARVVPVAAGFDVDDRGWWWFRRPGDGELGEALGGLRDEREK
ncbi:hypothetical protein ACFYTF_15260 [Nocardia thailandica]|uniref:Uncharacterized protein n=1 Tax=Nocardia thailandica TaxID=257275 RepID=A0ABW6PP93_9NOCA